MQNVCAPSAETAGQSPAHAPLERASLQRAMHRYARGETAAFDDVYALLAPRLYRICIHLAGRAEAEDLMQEVFVKMHRARDSFGDGGDVVAWAFAIARCAFIDRARYRKRRPAEPVPDEQLAHRASHTASPESASRGRALERLVEESLAKMPEGQRMAFVMVRIEGLGCGDAAAVLGTSVSAVKQRVFRASHELQSALDASGW